MAVGTLVDTCILTDVLRGYVPAAHYLRGSSEPFYISATSVAELFQHIKDGPERAALSSLISAIEIISLDAAIAERAGIIAEELDADWAKVKVQQSPIAPVYDHPIFKSQFVVASITVRGYWMPCRIAGAQARKILIDAVAQRWNVPAVELTTEPSMVVHAKSGRKLSYGDIAAVAEVPAKAPDIKPEQLKKTSEFRLIGKDVMRVELPTKVNGTAQYGIDIQVPGMVYGTVLRAPVEGSASRQTKLKTLRA